MFVDAEEVPDRHHEREQDEIGQDGGVLKTDFCFRAPLAPFTGLGLSQAGFCAGNEVHRELFAQPVCSWPGSHGVHTGKRDGQSDFPAGSRNGLPCAIRLGEYDLLVGWSLRKIRAQTVIGLT